MIIPSGRATPELSALLDLFYQDAGQVGVFTEVQPADLPDVPRQLLAHDKHMTVTVEAFHGCPVDVKVLESRTSATHYARRILLHRQSDGQVVLFGLVRLALAVLDPEVRREIESERIPLGRVLIDHNVMRDVRLLSLWRIRPGVELCRHLQLDGTQDCYGRTALLYCDSVPAIELLEILPPV
ncbi:MAG: hypothetical protein AB7F89_11370 [Pirellulaceae bacterium]